MLTGKNCVLVHESTCASMHACLHSSIPTCTCAIMCMPACMHTYTTDMPTYLHTYTQTNDRHTDRQAFLHTCMQLYVIGMLLTYGVFPLSASLRSFKKEATWVRTF